MSEIPKEIAERLTFESSPQDSTLYLTRIKPEEPCECGRELDNTRVVRISYVVSPVPHWREWCNTCKLVSIYDEHDFKEATELNKQMRKKSYGYHDKDK